MGLASFGTLADKMNISGKFTFRSGKVARVTGLEPATSGVTGRHSNQLSYTRAGRATCSAQRPPAAANPVKFTFRSRKVARVTGLEPATSGVTGRHSNQLSYTRAGWHLS